MFGNTRPAGATGWSEKNGDTPMKTGTNNNEKYQALISLFKKAKEAAIASDPGDTNDGGTCNLDSPAFSVPQMRTETIKEIAFKAGLNVCEFSHRGKRAFWLGVPLHGQGNRRAKMARAAGNVLRDFGDAGSIPGFRGWTYYAMD